MVARTADEGGFEFIAVMDHFFQIRGVGPAEREMLEAYTTLGYLAACRSEEHTSELQSRSDLVCRLLLEKKKKKRITNNIRVYKVKDRNEAHRAEEHNI